MPKLPFAFGLILVCACSPKSPTPAEPCPSLGPTFHLTLTDSEGTLRSDAKLRVKHGAGCEIYDIFAHAVAPCAPSDKVGVAFCSVRVPSALPAGGAAGASGAPTTSQAVPGGAGGAESTEPGALTIGEVECSLYTDGAATVSVWEGDEKILEREFNAKRDERCGILTLEVLLDLVQKIAP